MGVRKIVFQDEGRERKLIDISINIILTKLLCYQWGKFNSLEKS